jgi:hypothetical protein
MARVVLREPQTINHAGAVLLIFLSESADEVKKSQNQALFTPP